MIDAHVHLRRPGLNDCTRLPVLGTLRAPFGPARLIRASDWSVVTLRRSYRAWHDLAAAAIPAAERAALFGGNAGRIDGLAQGVNT